ncbi:hypothetical protein FHL15_007888 [Xylaria flabelliformis]|uniref:Uncharacterized protein n=1 Tax=Xylaria flabelliformis TaxID=2512241 RepID=A0A553HTK5_9PEZI|nr:hypothetical protein FHL15_007888 [Xylaria flabelliformis]
MGVSDVRKTRLECDAQTEVLFEFIGEESHDSHLIKSHHSTRPALVPRLVKLNGVIAKTTFGLETRVDSWGFVADISMSRWRVFAIISRRGRLDGNSYGPAVLSTFVQLELRSHSQAQSSDGVRTLQRYKLINQSQTGRRAIYHITTAQ